MLFHFPYVCLPCKLGALFVCVSLALSLGLSMGDWCLGRSVSLACLFCLSMWGLGEGESRVVVGAMQEDFCSLESLKDLSFLGWCSVSSLILVLETRSLLGNLA